MYVKSPNLIGILLCGALSMQNAIAQSGEPQCYPSAETFMSQEFGRDYLQDENISSKDIEGTQLFMVTDHTPSHNPPRYLLARDSRSSICITLIAQQAETIKFSQQKISGLPVTVTTLTGGQSKNDIQIKYQLNEEKRTYKAIECKSISRKSSKTKKLSCESPFSEFGK